MTVTGFADELVLTTPAAPDEPVVAIKLLDLLTKRYHLGAVLSQREDSLELELPLSTHLQAGQRVRFIIAGDQGLVASHEMRGAVVVEAHRDVRSKRLHLVLGYAAQAAAA